MVLDDFKKGLMEMYQGEVIGEVAHNLLLDYYDDPVHRYKVAVIMQLETETKARLRPAVMALGLDPAELEASRETGRAFAASMKGLSWNEAMAMMRDGVKPYIDRYLEVEAMAPAEYRDVARSMVVHEQSIYRFAELEAMGDHKHSLDDVLPQIEHPLPAPS